MFGSLRAETPEDTFLGKEAVERISAGIDALLTGLEKDVLALFLGGESYAEIAARLGCGTKTVDNALHRVKRKLDKHLRHGE